MFLTCTKRARKGFFFLVFVKKANFYMVLAIKMIKLNKKKKLC